MTQHHLGDILLYLVFLAGQSGYIAKRAGFSMRAGRAATRRAYVYQNWDNVILPRVIGALVLIYGPVRHYSPVDVLSLVHLNFSWMASIHGLNIPVSSPIAMVGLGYAADGLLDWLVDYASRSTVVPQVVRNWLAENLPPMPLTKQ